VYVCVFSGTFTDFRKIGLYEYSMRVRNLSAQGTRDEERIEDGVRYITSNPYGFDNADEFRLYLPGMSGALLPEEFKGWVMCYAKTLPFYGLYNIGGQQGFSGETTETEIDDPIPQMLRDIGTQDKFVTDQVVLRLLKYISGEYWCAGEKLWLLITDEPFMGAEGGVWTYSIYYMEPWVIGQIRSVRAQGEYSITVTVEKEAFDDGPVYSSGGTTVVEMDLSELTRYGYISLVGNTGSTLYRFSSETGNYNHTF